MNKSKPVRYRKTSATPESLIQEAAPGYLVEKVRDGLPMEEFQTLQEMLEFTEEQLATVLGISRATLHRRKKSGQLDRNESDHLVRFARILVRATEVFRDLEAARVWLKTPARAFNGERPLDFADTEVGAREVEALLGRIEHGVFS